MTKRILVTGATGFVGSHLLDRLLKSEDAELFGLCRVNSSRQNVRHLEDVVTWLPGDLCDATSMHCVLLESCPDEIYHLGALSWVSPSWKQPAQYAQTNAIGTINLLEAVLDQIYTKGKKPRILVSCTPEEYGDVSEDKLPITEGSEIAPVNPYAASKVAQDAFCQSYFASYQMPIIRTRAFNHEGPRRNANGALANFARQIARIEAGLQKPVVSVGNLSARRNFTDVRDMACAYQLAMKHGVPGELYLIGSTEIHTIEECLKMLIRLSTRAEDITYETDPAKVRPTELNNLIGDCSKFEKLTGYKPAIPFAYTLQDILNYWRKEV